jgi:ABC-2 type transport system ATP-binding protein
VSKSFRDQLVVKGVNLDLAPGKIHGIIGRNGSGKTVLMRIICGLYRASAGTVTVQGKRVGVDIEFPANMGILIETPGFLPFYSGRKNLRILAGLRGKIDQKCIDETIALVGLSPAERKHVGKYSLGMKQRLGIAQAIMEDPDLLILDEPFNGLDKQGVKDMRELLKGLRDQRKTILLASHNAQDIDELCDDVYEMDAGILTRIGPEKTRM